MGRRESVSVQFILNDLSLTKASGIHVKEISIKTVYSTDEPKMLTER